MILAYVVAAEAAIAVILTLPAPKAIQSRISSLISRIVQPSLFIVPFSAFQLLGTQFLRLLGMSLPISVIFGFLFFVIYIVSFFRGLLFCFLIFFLFELILDIYWKSEHRLKCSGETCTAAERSRYERAVITISLFWENKIFLF